MTPPNSTLAAALARRQIVLPEPQVELLDRYCRALWEWNSKINLTRHTDYEKFVDRDLVDTLTFERFLAPGERVLDVGTGGGVPGLPLALIRDDLRVELAESVGKKARAVADIVGNWGSTCRCITAGRKNFSAASGSTRCWSARWHRSGSCLIGLRRTGVRSTGCSSWPAPPGSSSAAKPGTAA